MVSFEEKTRGKKSHATVQLNWTRGEKLGCCDPCQTQYQLYYQLDYNSMLMFIEFF